MSLQYIHHRRNTLQELRETQPEWGVEIDLRSFGESRGDLRVVHDPWTGGLSFKEWIIEFQALKIQGPLILNTKEDQLEEALFEMMKANGIDNFLFLDTALPTLVKNVNQGNGKHFMMRLSKYEPLAAAEKFIGKVEWLWVDCFGGEPLDEAIVLEASKKFKLCLVSPELQRQDPAKIDVFAKIKKYASLVCTKCPDLWEAL